MRRYIIPILALILVNTGWGGTFHTFTSKEGQVVTAQIVGYSSHTGKVKLERENGRKVWVDPAIFSTEDQAFIAAWGKEDSKPKDTSETDPENIEVKELSRTEIRNIAKQYKKAWEDHDFAAWSSLLEVQKEKGNLSEHAFNNEGVKSIMIRSVDGHNVYVEYNIVLPDNQDTANAGTVGLIEKRHGWLQILPDGKIKYTPILFKHPMDEAMRCLYDIFPYKSWPGEKSPEECQRIVQDSVNTLDRLGIPTFGYNLDVSESKRNDAFQMIYDWILDNHETWDETEPGIPCPEDLFKERLDRIKKIK